MMHEQEDDAAWVFPGPDLSPVEASSDRLRGDAESRPMLHPSSVAGRFQVRACIGQGGMGAVYRARDSLRRETVAIKVLVPGLLQDEAALKQFQTEAAIATRLSHPNIVTVYDFHAVDGSYAIVMELLEGRTLREEIRARSGSGMGLPADEVCKLLQPVCDALAHAHHVTVHRDVKPENIWVGQDGTIKLMDFGLAKLIPRDADPLSLHTLSQLRLGSPYYMAPEQLQPGGQATAAADQFAVGVIAYELLSGSLPIGLAQPLRQVRPDLPYQLTDAVDRALASNPGERFTSIQAFWNAFEAGCRARPSLRQRLDTKPLLRRVLTGTAAVAVLGVAGSWAVSAMRERADGLIQRTGRALEAADTIRSEIGALRDQADALRRDRAEAAAAWKEAQEKPSLETGSLPEQLERELQRHRTGRAAAEAELVWKWLSPRLDSQGVHLAVSRAQAILEDHLQDRDFEGFALARERLEEILGREERIISHLPRLAATRVSQTLLAHATQALAADAPPSGVAENALAALDMTPPPDERWARATKDAEAGRAALLAPLRDRFEELMDTHTRVWAAWTALFPSELGPPPIEFLGHPKAKAEAALAFQEIDHSARAIALMEEAIAEVRRWTDDVTSLRRRCEAVWSQAQAEGRAFENAIGMRFVRVRNHYWCLWETRVMDFARYVALDGNAPKHVGKEWMDPGFPVGPTHPVLFVGARNADHFGAWIGRQFRGLATEDGRHAVPRIKVWRELLATEPQWQKQAIKQALFPDFNELQTSHWRLKYADSEIDPGQFIRPVGMGEPSANGLYGLFDNAWEWAYDFVTFPKGVMFEDGEFRTLFGGGFFGQIGFNGQEPPDDETVFVGRGDGIGFRLTLNAQVIDERLGRERKP